jgi:hypothetical protein
MRGQFQAEQTFRLHLFFRDPSAWYHFLFVKSGTSSMTIYQNGIQIAQTTSSVPSSSPFNTSSGSIYIGYAPGSGFSAYANSYLADIHFIDGQALTPSSFGEFDTNNVWQPKAYTGTYGTNGFHLDFADNSNNTATTLGKDTSGNGNNWTPNNLSVTAGAGNDSLVDSPTSYGTDTGAGGEVRGNYCTLNPLDKGGGASAVNGNLDLSLSSAGSIRSTIGLSSGKWYWETTVGAISLTVGIAKAGTALSAFLGSQVNEWSYGQNATKITGGSSSAYGATFTTGDVIGIAFDADNGTLTFYKNGSSQGTAFTGLTSGPYFPAIGDNSATSGHASNFGQRPFAYTAPSGFKALCTANLPTPTIANGSTAMDVKLYTGNGSTQTISGLNFSPDFLWFKARSDSGQHALYDIIRGTTKSLVSNSTVAEATEGGGLSTFNSDGFSLSGDNTIQGSTNGSGRSYVAWCWDAGSSTVTNTQGSITSQVRANASAGFSVVTYTGNDTAGATVGHGLGVAPQMIINKARDLSTNWSVYHISILPTGNLRLNSDAGIFASVLWDSTAPTTTVFSIGSSSTINSSTSGYVAYCFAPVEGYSAFGSYTGNGSADGSFIYLGFLPRLVLLKRTDTTSNWTILDTSRLGYNVDNNPLYPNLSNAEATTDLLDITSNGFKLRTTDASVNASGGTYIYAAWAENPFTISRAR